MIRSEIVFPFTSCTAFTVPKVLATLFNDVSHHRKSLTFRRGGLPEEKKHNGDNVTGPHCGTVLFLPSSFSFSLQKLLTFFLALMGEVWHFLFFIELPLTDSGQRNPM